jgi:Tfp pilus assembly protein PilO
VLPEKAAAMQQVRADATECERLSAELTVLNARVTQQPEDFELLAWLEEGARRCGCEPEAIRPRREEMEEGFGQVVVEVTFKGVQVEALARFMSRIATAPGAVALRDLHISQGLTPGRVDAACTVVHLTSE